MVTLIVACANVMFMTIYNNTMKQMQAALALMMMMMKDGD